MIDVEVTTLARIKMEIEWMMVRNQAIDFLASVEIKDSRQLTPFSHVPSDFDNNITVGWLS